MWRRGNPQPNPFGEQYNHHEPLVPLSLTPCIIIINFSAYAARMPRAQALLASAERPAPKPTRLKPTMKTLADPLFINRFPPQTNPQRSVEKEALYSRS